MYYSGYVPVLEDKRLPPLSTQVPLRRENRLYQADWLMRFYGFSDHEILDEQQPFLDLDFDPKLAWALRHREWFPVPLQHAPLEIILRVPGIGVKSARKIVQARRFRIITMAQLSKMGVALNRARYFITLPGPNRYADLNRQPATTRPAFTKHTLQIQPKRCRAKRFVRLIAKRSTLCKSLCTTTAASTDC